MNGYANKVLCFGELLLRLSPKGNERIEQSAELQFYFDGAEAMAALSLAYQGQNVAYLSSVSDNRIGTRALMSLSGAGIDISRVMRKPGRMGLFYFERGASDRMSTVIYDRDYTPITMMRHEEFDWDSLLNGIDAFYFSGIILAISDEMRIAVIQALQACKGRGIKTFCDLNYRPRMWDRALARSTWVKLLPYVDICIGCDEDIWSLFAQPNINPNRSTTFDYVDYYRDTALSISKKYECHTVAIEIRALASNGVGRWSGMIIRDDTMSMSETREIMNGEHSGCGDSFAAGVTLGCLEGWRPSTIINYALMASVLKSTIPGSINYLTRDEIVSAAGSSLTLVDY